MNKKIFRDLMKNAINIGRRFWGVRRERPNLIVFSFLFILVATLVFSYDNSVKKKRLEQIDFFISSDQTVLLKNWKKKDC